MLNLRVNFKVYFLIMKGEIMEMRLIGDVIDSDNVFFVYYCFFKFFCVKCVGIGKFLNLRFSEENVLKESVNLFFLFVELYFVMYILFLFVYELCLVL